MSAQRLALDVGGANIKTATAGGYTSSRVFSLWNYPERLADELTQLIMQAPPCNAIVATMTGELADCYASKREGVTSIVTAINEAAAGRPVSIYLIDGTFVSPNIACEQYQLAAASNWHALARFATRFASSETHGNAILVDIGSTTCDVIPIAGKEVVASGRTDTERLLAHELVYMGIERTPVCSISPSVPYRGQTCPLARELFATTLDIHLLTADIAERPNDTDTADGRPATREFALARLARCVCADQREFHLEDGLAIANFLSNTLAKLLRNAINTVSARCGFGNQPMLILSGHGDFLLRRANATNAVCPLRERIGRDASRCAPAIALATLADEVAGGSS